MNTTQHNCRFLMCLFIVLTTSACHANMPDFSQLFAMADDFSFDDMSAGFGESEGKDDSFDNFFSLIGSDTMLASEQGEKTQSDEKKEATDADDAAQDPEELFLAGKSDVLKVTAPYKQHARDFIAKLVTELEHLQTHISSITLGMTVQETIRKEHLTPPQELYTLLSKIMSQSAYLKVLSLPGYTQLRRTIITVEKDIETLNTKLAQKARFDAADDLESYTKDTEQEADSTAESQIVAILRTAVMPLHKDVTALIDDKKAAQLIKQKKERNERLAHRAKKETGYTHGEDIMGELFGNNNFNENSFDFGGSMFGGAAGHDGWGSGEFWDSLGDAGASQSYDDLFGSSYENHSWSTHSESSFSPSTPTSTQAHSALSSSPQPRSANYTMTSSSQKTDSASSADLHRRDTAQALFVGTQSNQEKKEVRKELASLEEMLKKLSQKLNAGGDVIALVAQDDVFELIKKLVSLEEDLALHRRDFQQENKRFNTLVENHAHTLMVMVEKAVPALYAKTVERELQRTHKLPAQKAREKAYRRIESFTQNKQSLLIFLAAIRKHREQRRDLFITLGSELEKIEREYIKNINQLLEQSNKEHALTFKKIQKLALLSHQLLSQPTALTFQAPHKETKTEFIARAKKQQLFQDKTALDKRITPIIAQHRRAKMMLLQYITDALERVKLTAQKKKLSVTAINEELTKDITSRITTHHRNDAIMQRVKRDYLPISDTTLQQLQIETKLIDKLTELWTLKGKELPHKKHADHEALAPAELATLVVH